MSTTDQDIHRMQHSKSQSERWQIFCVILRNLWRAFRLIWNAHPYATFGMTFSALIIAVLPVAQAWVGKLIVDTVVSGISNQLVLSEVFHLVLPYVLMEFSFFVLNTLLSEGQALLQQLLSSRLIHSVNLMIMHKTLELDLLFFEDASFYNKLQNAQSNASSRSFEIVNNIFLFSQNIITFTSFLVILIAFSPLITIFLILLAIPAFIVRIRNSSEKFGFVMGSTTDYRRMFYIERLITTDQTIKEIKLFNLGIPLIDRYINIFKALHHKEMNLAYKRVMINIIWSLLGATTYYGAYAWVVWRTIQRTITIGDMTLYLTLCRQFQTLSLQMFFAVSQIYEASLFLENLFAFLGQQPQTSKQASWRPFPKPIGKGIEIRNLSFRYPGHQDWALRNINLYIAPGEKLALVGANGAGKTTLIKLLTRLYEPSEGQILIDGVNLCEYDVDDLREHIGVIFQDFVRYQATLRDNIGFGKIADLDDNHRIVNAARCGGADEITASLPRGYDSMLGCWFEQGCELSGGQWQKIALSRAFMRQSEVLILDEPTSALDAEHEYEIFQRFRDLTENKIALLISHRFSTVRMADRIAVIENGQITEIGSHDELLKYSGTYARLFNLQAEGYR